MHVYISCADDIGGYALPLWEGSAHLSELAYYNNRVHIICAVCIFETYMDWRGAWYIIINCFFHLKKGTADIREYSI
jgi:hypothetical protein